MSAASTSTALIDSQGHPYWVQRSALARWWADRSPRGSSSGELLLEWLEKSGHTRYFFAGQGGEDRKKGGKLAADYSKDNYGPTLRTWQASRNQITGIQSMWKKAFDWANGTGNGRGQRQISDAPDDQKETTTATLQQECEKRCRQYSRLRDTFLEVEGGTARELRGDTAQGSNPVLEQLVPRSHQPLGSPDWALDTSGSAGSIEEEVNELLADDESSGDTKMMSDNARTDADRTIEKWSLAALARDNEYHEKTLRLLDEIGQRELERIAFDSQRLEMEKDARQKPSRNSRLTTILAMTTGIMTSTGLSYAEARSQALREYDEAP
ncbi:MAG: hypothetical protein TREMPRED_003014 [Tremellales sp. Tagirdzhanova-0007]|nr:MAG: hypothetical protein TREMPRED_003014 [Tremellales sp. Tagirdzhanova-0007]